jgi:hypothetical protein
MVSPPDCVKGRRTREVKLEWKLNDGLENSRSPGLKIGSLPCFCIARFEEPPLLPHLPIHLSLSFSK